MDENKKERLAEAGIDVENALERFMGNEGLLERFLKKFLNDQNFSKLTVAIGEKKEQEALAASHTLKGYAETCPWEDCTVWLQSR